MIFDPQKTRFSPDQPLTQDQVREAIDELLRFAPGPGEKKYVVALASPGSTPYLYFLYLCGGHQHALQLAVERHKASGRPTSEVMACYVAGACQDTACGCGARDREITYLVRFQRSNAGR